MARARPDCAPGHLAIVVGYDIHALAEATVGIE